MAWFEGMRSKLRETNDALASAHNSWRESRLDDRERNVAEREAEISLKLAEMRAIESRRWRRKLGTFSIACLSAVGGFAVGASGETTSASTNSEITKPPSDNRPASAANDEPAPPPPAPRPDELPPADIDSAALNGKYGFGGKFDVGRYCLDKEKQGEATFEECLGAAALALKSSR